MGEQNSPEPTANVCENCNNPLTENDRVNELYRIETVETIPVERITINDEERQRQGFELQTTYRFLPGPDGLIQKTDAKVVLDDEELATLRHGLFHIWIRKPGCGEAEQEAGKHTQERCAFTIRQNMHQPRPLHLAEELRKTVQADGSQTDPSKRMYPVWAESVMENPEIIKIALIKPLMERVATRVTPHLLFKINQWLASEKSASAMP